MYINCQIDFIIIEQNTVNQINLVYEVEYSKNLHVRAQNMILFHKKILSLVGTEFLEFPEHNFLLGLICFLNANINI